MDTIKSEGRCGKDIGWILCCIGAGFSMGTGAFIYASNYAEYGLFGAGVLGPIPFLTTSLAKIIREVHFRCKTGTWVRETDSTWFKDDGRFRWSSIIPLTANTLLLFAYIVVMSIAWDFASKAGLNQGVISQLLFFASIINCITFYCCFGEKISKLHLIGVALLCAGIVCIGVSAAQQNEDDLDEGVDTGGRSPLLNGILALLIGFGGPTVICIMHFTNRKFGGVYKGVDQGLDSAVPRALIFTCLIPALQ